MAQDQQIIEFKTGAWQSNGMVANYARAMHDVRGTIRLKNEIEVDLFKQFVKGVDLLDVGTGTGRASIPLALDGHRVTAVDASQAMLDQCRKEAGNLPIDLRIADVTALPFEAESFDCAVSLNVASHFPNWRDLLKEWSRVVRPSGRIVFDIHSYDHLAAVAQCRGCKPEDLLTEAERTEPIHYFARASQSELLDAADALDLTLIAAAPYGMIYGGGNLNYWFLDTLLWGAAGDRLLSALTVDQLMYEFARFIENTVARLTIASTPRFVAVFEKRVDREGSRETFNKASASESALLRGDVTGFAGDDRALWISTLGRHLEHAPNRALAAAALSGSAGPMLKRLVDESEISTKHDLFDAHRRLVIERQAESTMEQLHGAISIAGLGTFNGVDVSGALNYAAMSAIVETTFSPKVDLI